MNIKNIDGLWCDDITFCMEKCAWTDCPRNSQNIRDKSIPHSFSVEIPLDCPKKQEGAAMIDINKTIEDLNLLNKLCHGTVLDDAITIIKEQKDYIYELQHAPSVVPKMQQPIVKCKDCKHFAPDGIYTMCYRHNGLSQGADWFCADGERK